ncbi:DNA primase [Pseudoclavibacter endophyticus]|uniref:DNA primase n=1 Tax=Pseudoclavibacter endophyticus TaxID=1778590 RepID=A0A6H9WSQ0_9MICO|nr:DNA primase [Pseudoclavibacter endophyticus]KAB1649957.1 DNA primase [Pseudoclavibacter endophyticus]GGA58413.1 DNA primase [Pseudoclavibacter endophyticus]
MARIRKTDIEEVRSRTDLAEIVGDYVTLRNAGVGSMKGLCPFHDERTPSFNIRPALGHFHCFGCGESGDVYSFLQKIDHITFTEAVERLAARLGYTVTYEDGGSVPDGSRRIRLLQANRAAEAFFRSRLATHDAAPAQQFLGGRGFDGPAAEHFGVGYAPKSWDALKSHLVGEGFTDQELRDAGLVSVGDRGSSYDRFRGRVVWPIRDTTGQTVGFGARKLFDDDQGPKYLNTPETPVYHKQQALYGLDLAKRAIARDRRVVVVEGYTDVMAAHLAGVPAAVATCGTSFGVDHIKVLRRILDDESGNGRVIFTFDPDEAGQKAAMKAFEEERRFVAQTFVAVAPDGYDPCDLRLHRGDAAVRDLVDTAVPMHEFVIKRQLEGHDLDTVEGRVAALRQAAPVVAGIRDPAIRPGYSRQLARWLGMDLPMVERAVTQAGRGAGRGGARAASGGATPSGGQGRSGWGRGAQSSAHRSSTRSADGWIGDPPPGPNEQRRGVELGGVGAPRGRDSFGGGAGGAGAAGASAAFDAGMPPIRMADLGADPVTRLESQVVMALLQYPTALERGVFERILACEYANATLATVRDGIAASRQAIGTNRWIAIVSEEVPQQFANLVSELAVTPLPTGDDDAQITAYVRAIGASLIERDLLRRKAELLGALQRADQAADPERSLELQRALVEIENEKRALREE